MKAIAILFGLAAASGVSYGIWQYLARKDDQKKYVAALLTAKAISPTDPEGVFTPPVAGVNLMGAHGVNLMGAYGVTRV